MSKRKKLVSIGIICFNEEPNVFPAYKELTNVLDKNTKYDYEFLYIDNNSTDNTRAEIRKVAKLDKRVNGIFLSRNFGPESSIKASLDFSKGDAYVCYEGDMQDPPKTILRFLAEWEKGFSVVVGVRPKNPDAFIMNGIRKLYYRIFKAVSNINIPVDAGSFALLDRKVVDAIRNMPEKYRFYRGLRAWVGFETSYIIYSRRKRQRGKSSYNFLNYISYAERSFFGFSYFPLDVIVYTGFATVCLSLLAFTIYFIFNIVHKGILSEFIILLFSMVFFGGIQLFAISLIGKYIQVIVEETKSRPVYIVKEIVKHKTNKSS